MGRRPVIPPSRSAEKERAGHLLCDGTATPVATGARMAPRKGWVLDPLRTHQRAVRC
ncbi:uncharacterized protein METZ01_LOCUS241975, partial [marine metagenome]